MNRNKYRRLFGSSMLALSVIAGTLGTLAEAANGVSSGKAPAIDSLIEPLQKKLQDNPQDAGNWALLGRSYEYLGRRQDAEKAFARARELGYELPATITRRPAQSTLDPTLLRWMADTTRRPIAGEAGAK
jgi:predicted Zn-dependent protease